MRNILALVLTISGLIIPMAGAENEFARVPAARAEQAGRIPDGVTRADIVVLADEPEGGVANIRLPFDLEAVAQSATPLARLQLGTLEKLPVKRPGQKSTAERGALHVFAVHGPDDAGELAGSMPLKPGGLLNPYTIDVTRAVSEALARPPGQRKLTLEVRIEGKPLPYEVYGLAGGEGKSPVALEIASLEGWTDDFAQCLTPLATVATIYRESCLPLADDPRQELTLRLLHPAKRIIEVVVNATQDRLAEGRDWILRDGQLVLPPGSHAPVQLAAEFFSAPHTDKNGEVKNLPTAVRLVEGTWYHERQIEVTYEPAARDWSWPAPRSTLEQLPRLKNLLTTRAPVKLILFGDSISAGYNASKFIGVRPYQPCWGEMVARALEQSYGGKVTFMNHSRGGATSAFAAGQADAQVAWFHPDLAIIAYGMNDRAEGRREQYRANLEKIIDSVRARSPETEFLIVTSMLNNPKQPTGLDPILFIHDEALKIARPGVALADVTAAHGELLKHKNYLDLSGNGANHPNDFLHRVYAQQVLQVLIPAAAKHD